MTAVTHLFVHHDAALSEPQPEARVHLVGLHRLDEAVEGGKRLGAVQLLHTHVVQQLVVLAHPEGVQGAGEQEVVCGGRQGGGVKGILLRPRQYVYITATAK